MQTPLPPPDADPYWTTAPLDELIEHILWKHHRPLDQELPRLRQLTATVRDAHPEHAASLAKVQLTLDAIVQDLVDHMPKEEQVLFPLILSGRGHVATMPMHVMGAEHRELETRLDELAALTDDFQAPPGACPTWQALWQGLGALRDDLVLHIYLEDEVLFPRAAVPPGAGV